MSKNNKHKLIPKLRFPEFQNEGEWKVKKLGEVLEKNKEKNKDRKYTLVQSVSNKFGFINQDEYFENRIVASKDTSNYYVIRKGCFAYNPSRIDVGSLAYKNDENISIISPLYVSFKAKNDKVLDLYLLNWFRSNGFIEQMIFEGGVRNTLNFDNLIEISIPLPSLPEQEKIASCLSSLDEVITGEQQKLELLKQHKKGLLQNLFPQEGETVPKLRFKEFENSGEWEVKRLGEVCEINPSISKLPKEFIYIDLESVKDGQLFQTKKISIDNAPSRAQRLLRKNDIIFQMVRPYQRNNLLFNLDGFNYVASTGYAQLRTSQSPEFLYYQLHTDFFVFRVLEKCTGTNYPAINTEELTKIEVFVPSLPEQQKIASCLSSLDEIITAQTQKIEQLQRHKKGLLQGLFPNINNE